MISSIAKHFFILILLLFATQLTYSQTGTIVGFVIDAQTKESLIGVSSILESTQLGAVTDFDGNFIIPGVPAGTYTLKSTFISYETNFVENLLVKQGDTVLLKIELKPVSIELEGVTISAKKNRELENVLLLDQKNSLTVTKSVGAAELSRKGIGDAETAVATVAGISKQEGVKNVVVRGLGDRYNATLLNGLPIPSEDPEYKNISLSFFETDIIKNIGVEKVFSTAYGSDVGGAVVNINSKELDGDHAFGLSVSSGFNSRLIGGQFLRPDGINYFGYSNQNKPGEGQFDFTNSLDPHHVSMPINENYRIQGGKKLALFNQPLSFYAMASHSSDYSYTEETIRNMTTDGTIYQNQQGKKYSGNKSQLALANVNYNLRQAHTIAYNFLMLHSTQYYTGEYFGRQSEKFQDAANDMGFLRRQQINDNALFVNQLLSKWKIAKQWEVVADISLNQINGNEPDRRENYLSERSDGSFSLTGSNRQKRFYSRLTDRDYNAKVVFDYLLNRHDKGNNSKISFGINSQLSDLFFEAEEYNFSAISGTLSPGNLLLDKLYNSANFKINKFAINQGFPSSYSVSKFNKSAFVSGSYQFSPAFSGVAGLQYDWVTMDVSYNVPGQQGSNQINTKFYLPSLHLKYNLNERHILRFGASKTYTLPQSKEISPYQYVNIGYTSEGNPNLRYSDNYNLDIKWDQYLSSSEILSASLFYKKILNPIGRVDKGNSAGLLTYDNISKEADVMGVEVELRKTIFSTSNGKSGQENNISFGMNASYILTKAKLSLENTVHRTAALEGASPLIVNGDLTYRFTKNAYNLTSMLMINYFSDRIFTIGTMGYADIIEKAVPTLDFILRGKLNQHLELKLKAGNILDPSFRLTREVKTTGEVVTLSEYKKGIDLSVGVSFDF